MNRPRMAQALDPGAVDTSQKLLVHGQIRLGPPDSAPVEVRREMSILGCDGVAMGTVAAVVVDPATQATTHILLCHLRPDLEYRLVPLTLIERVDEEAVQLRIPSPDVNQLPRRATD